MKHAIDILEMNKRFAVICDIKKYIVWIELL